jgi:hypothetical protein
MPLHTRAYVMRTSIIAQYQLYHRAVVSLELSNKAKARLPRGTREAGSTEKREALKMYAKSNHNSNGRPHPPAGLDDVLEERLNTLRCFSDHFADEMQAGRYRKARPARVQRAGCLLQRAASLVAQAGDVLCG